MHFMPNNLAKLGGIVYVWGREMVMTMEHKGVLEESSPVLYHKRHRLYPFC